MNPSSANSAPSPHPLQYLAMLNQNLINSNQGLNSSTSRPGQTPMGELQTPFTPSGQIGTPSDQMGFPSTPNLPNFGSQNDMNFSQYHLGGSADIGASNFLTSSLGIERNIPITPAFGGDGNQSAQYFPDSNLADDNGDDLEEVDVDEQGDAMSDGEGAAANIDGNAVLANPEGPQHIFENVGTDMTNSLTQFGMAPTSIPSLGTPSGADGTQMIVPYESTGGHLIRVPRSERRQKADEAQFVNITHLLSLPQHEASAILNLPTSTFSKRWKEAVKVSPPAHSSVVLALTLSLSHL